MSIYLGFVRRTENERGTFFTFTPIAELIQEGVHFLTTRELSDLFRPSDRPDLQFTCQPDNVPAVYQQFSNHFVVINFENKDNWYQEDRGRYVIRQREVIRMLHSHEMQTLPFYDHPDPEAIAAFQREQADLTQAIEALRRQQEELTQETGNLTQTRDRMREELQESEQKKTQLQDETASLEDQRTQLQANFQREQAELAQALETLRRQQEELALETDNLSSFQNRAQEEIQELEQKKVHLQSETANLEDQKAQLDAYFQDVMANPLAKLGTLAADNQLTDWMQQVFPPRQKAEEPYSHFLPYPCPNGEQALAEALCGRVREFRPNYNCLDILNIAVCLTQGFLTVFFGAPGCGKTSICNIFAKVLGLYAPDRTRNAVRYVPVSVERGWMSKRDFIGYFNPLTKTFGSSNRQVYDALRHLHTEEAVRQIVQEGSGPVLCAPIPFLILLDEANLSAMEYYWADFMNLCEDRLTEGRLLQFDGTRRKIRGTVNLGEEQLEVPDWLRFAATINTDHTTETLSPRLLDRAWLVSLPSMDESISLDLPEPQMEPLRVSWPELQDAFGGHGEPWPNDIHAIFSDLAACLQNECRTTVSHRVRRAVRGYWSGAARAFGSVWPQEGAYCGYANPAVAALDYAIAQRVLPQLQGSGEGFAGKLTAVENKCTGYGLRKSAAIVQDVRERGEESEYFQFF